MRILNTESKRIVITCIAFCVFVAVFITGINAQTQDTNFSGNDVNSYQCFDDSLNSFTPTGVKDDQGRFLCCKDGSSPVNKLCGGSPTCVDLNGKAPGAPGDKGCQAALATLRPPKLQQIEIWFVRILYVVWALVAAISVFFLVALGYRYMISRGDVTKITEIRQRIIYYFIGFILVFLAVPILSTVFRLLGVNNNVQCYDVEMPAFQFFFNDLCTAPNLEYYCGIRSFTSGSIGLACSNPGEVYQCTTGFFGSFPRFTCDPTTRVWTR